MITITPTKPLELALSPDEARLLLAFRAMDDRRKEESVIRMQRIAETHPWRTAPRLRLVAGGGG